MGAAPCGGDCDADGRVGIEELIAGVGSALGDADAGCGADLDDDGRVAVNELIRLVGVALHGPGAEHWIPLPPLAVSHGVMSIDV